MDLLALPVGTLLRLGEEAVVEVTGLRNPCLQIDNFRKGLLKQVVGRDEEGRRVLKAGCHGRGPARRHHPPGRPHHRHPAGKPRTYRSNASDAAGAGAEPAGASDRSHGDTGQGRQQIGQLRQLRVVRMAVPRDRKHLARRLVEQDERRLTGARHQ